MPMKKEILIVEDNEINREMLTDIVSEKYLVWQAKNGQAALDLLKDHKNSISLILLDVQMPVMDGYTFLNRVKEDEALSLIPVIVMTQSNSEEDELAALAHGATDYLPKPYRPQIILHRIASLIKLRETAAIANLLQYDRLTGLYSREFFYQKVRERLQEDPQEEYSIICSNIENFKMVNEVFGSQEGDRLLKEVAERTMRSVGPDGFCGRFSADRFLCLQKRKKERADRENFAVAPDMEVSTRLKSVVMRWGIYEITDRTIPVEQMCDRALLAVDSIKNQYHQYFSVYDDSLRRRLLREQTITSSMETALREEQFEVYLQPKYSLSGNCLAGAEALVRWNHPELGFLSPGEFIPLFEKNGFIEKLDHFVREKVCRQLGAWKANGDPLLPISVNISRADVFQENLADSIFATTQKYGVDPAYLHLEITESAYVSTPDLIVDVVNSLRKLGFFIEMDDFGSGYSSFNMLSHMSVDVLKLDMKFIQNELAKPSERSFLNDVIRMSHRADLDVVAEGVETREQMDRLQAAGCDFAQGYFFANPMPIAEYDDLLKRQNKVHISAVNPESARSQDYLLVVDEDAAYRKMVRETFSSQYPVVEASSAEEALAQVSAEVSVVLLSMSLPDNGAVSVMNQLRQTPAFWNVPVLATIPSSQCLQDLPLTSEADDFLCKLHPMFDLKKRVKKLVNASSFRKRERSLLEAAACDPLTGLLNRRGFQNALSEVCDSDMPIALCVFDLDDLKKINDTFGHDMGDWMMRCLAEQFCAVTRPEDVKCRYGGDEFVLVLKKAHSETAVKTCERICRSFQDAAGNKGHHATCSVGVAMCETGKIDSSELIHRADQALYRVKREGKGRCVLWTDSCANEL